MANQGPTLLLVMGRTARDALFLTRFPVTWIAPVWITYGAVSALVALGYERAIRRLPRAKFGTAFALFAATTYLALRTLIGYDLRRVGHSKPLQKRMRLRKS